MMIMCVINCSFIKIIGLFIQLTFGVSVPVDMSKRGGLVFSSAYQFNYALPWNVSQLEPLIVSARQSRNLELQDIYTSLENLFDE